MNKSIRSLTTYMQTVRGSVNITDVPKVREPFLKRPLDVILSSIMIILSPPIFLPIALIIKLEDGGPVFYRQARWRRNGIRFMVYKFRTMLANSDQEFGIVHATENDPRVTRI
ncbi:MAG: sugar transferase, partial [Deltaproteobacteria bacterium]|nr:sugar transferase [Deltaproteobacteria bacterium]MBW2252521.1 sugar transferase [Deltaproteobacteria bacterium]